MLGLVAIGAVVYGLFYTSLLQASLINIDGLNEQHKQQVLAVINQRLGHKVFGIPVGRNLFFTSAGSLEADMSKQFTFLENISVNKNYPHALYVSGKERQAEGVWCVQNNCRFFDHEGIAWGEAAPSSGFLLLSIEDMRLASGSLPSSVDSRFLKAIQVVVPSLSAQQIKIKKIIIPADSFTEFNALTSEGYTIIFSLDSDIVGQLDAYRIFRDQKLKDIEPKPSYIDLRFDERIYFK
ncbi:MAG: hypothetical protein AAB638_04120 [Patescibacteria group bacterium]